MQHPTSRFFGGLLTVLFTIAFVAPAYSAQPHHSLVLFVCEHGNVKSLMAASYFNRLAQERGLPFSAVSRGTAPDSTTVPAAIAAGLHGDGFNVSMFHPVAVNAFDVSASQHVVLIDTALPPTALAKRVDTEQWNDVPPASVDYYAARESLNSHIVRLMDTLANTTSN